MTADGRMYLWLKAFHVIAVIAWMAGMLYLPRLFVYHCEAEPGSKQSETFKVMERRLLKAIINPAMVVTWVLGLWLAWSGGWYASGWLQAKIVAGMLMSGLHGFLRALRPEFRRRQEPAQCEILSDAQRGADGSPDRDRHSGGRKTVLTYRPSHMVHGSHIDRLCESPVFNPHGEVSPCAGTVFPYL